MKLGLNITEMGHFKLWFFFVPVPMENPRWLLPGKINKEKLSELD
jgi:hypothetical protein